MTLDKVSKVKIETMIPRLAFPEGVSNQCEERVTVALWVFVFVPTSDPSSEVSTEQDGSREL